MSSIPSFALCHPQLFQVFASTCYHLSFGNSHPKRCEAIPHHGVILICVSLMTGDAEHMLC